MALVLFVLSLVVLGLSDKTNVLVISLPAPGYSHQMIAVQISKLLEGESSYDVTLLADEAYRKFDLDRNVTFTNNVRQLYYNSGKNSEEVKRAQEEVSAASEVAGLPILMKLFTDQCDGMLDASLNPEVHKLVDSHFDVILLDSTVACGSGLIQLLKPKRVILYHVLSLYRPILDEMAMIPLRLGVDPLFGLGFSNQMNFLERTVNVLYRPLVRWLVFEYFYYAPMRAIINKHIPNTNDKNLCDYMREVADTNIFFDVPGGFDYPVYTPPNAHMIGSILTRPPNPLPDFLLDFIGDSPVILMSFGTVVDLTDEQSKMFAKAIEKFSEYKFIIKQNFVGMVEDFKHMSNVMVSTWVPQQDLLGHPNTKLFITHCGKNGANEAIYHGVKMAGFSFLADQPDNCQKVVTAKLGLTKATTTISSATEITEIIEGVLVNAIFEKNAKKLGQYVRSLDSQKQFVKLVEQTALFGSDHLKVPDCHESWWKIHAVDSFVFLGLVIGLLCYSCFKCCCQRCCQTRKLKAD